MAPPLAATISLDVHWSGVLRRKRLRDAVNTFTGDYVENTATMTFSAQREGFTFVSDPASTSVSVFSQIGRERNGVFFS